MRFWELSMKLINKQTGEIATLTLSSNGEELLLMRNNEMITHNVKLSDLEDWKDYEEPKEYRYIDDAGVIQIDQVLSSEINMRKSIGNYFETEEEAEKALEKLKAWKRLKDKGISFEVKVIDRKWYLEPKAEPQQRTFDEAYDAFKDIMFIFGGEE